MSKKQEDFDSQFEHEVKHNEMAFKALLKNVRPELWTIQDLLDATGINYLVLIHVIRHLNNIATGTKFGTVTIEVQNGTVTFVRSDESSRLNEPAILSKKLPLDMS